MAELYVDTQAKLIAVCTDEWCTFIIPTRVGDLPKHPRESFLKERRNMLLLPNGLEHLINAENMIATVLLEELSVDKP